MLENSREAHAKYTILGDVKRNRLCLYLRFFNPEMYANIEVPSLDRDFRGLLSEVT
jgi:hypothetical protein